MKDALWCSGVLGVGCACWPCEWLQASGLSRTPCCFCSLRHQKLCQDADASRSRRKTSRREEGGEIIINWILEEEDPKTSV